MSATLALSAFTPALAQGAQIAFGGLKHDSSLPIEITAEQLTIDQSDGSAVFTGDVLIGQGEMRLSAAKVRVEYVTGEGSTGEISRLHATGGVTLVNGAEAAEAVDAVYTVTSAQVVMTGSVILTQGQNALSGDRLTVDLTAGTGQMDGRVKTILQPGGE
ncbi:lipopolysaccharide transport periplasmic protein LptA [Aliiroseovarius sp.]|uniref:lipopolysaccharide transport periplasmic protein LptA n=1 Tax=Aliiroseovarius sp. TaxID=1872442 RepID=UPI002621816C|nr:lipopolysaccharide transport periplasmic protein LptA [Aliiroseovarius sp.]